MPKQKALIVVGMGFGDEGKGSCTEYYTKKYHALWNVRYNGGAQAAHNVVRPNGHHHRFQQFGSGTFEGASTFLSKHVIVHPLRILDEALALQDAHIATPLRNHFIDERALIITPYHQALNMLKERKRGDARHGSTGLGIGETRAFSLEYPDIAMHARDLRKADLDQHMRAIAEHILEQARELDSSAQIDEAEFEMTVDAYRAAGSLLHIVPNDFFRSQVMGKGDNVIFEGAQGILLDEKYGFYPHNTWTNTTAVNAMMMLDDSGTDDVDIRIIGVMRPYMSRHGAGPLPTEDSLLNTVVSDPHNSDGEFTGPMRYGYLDHVLMRYAIWANEYTIDELAITHADEIAKLPKRAANHYDLSDRHFIDLGEAMRFVDRSMRGVSDQLPSANKSFRTEVLKQITVKYDSSSFNERPQSYYLGIPVTLLSFGPTVDDKIEQPLDGLRTTGRSLRARSH